MAELCKSILASLWLRDRYGQYRDSSQMLLIDPWYSWDQMHGLLRCIETCIKTGSAALCVRGPIADAMQRLCKAITGWKDDQLSLR